MPGKHAPDSPASFYWSLARAATGALAALGLVVAIVLVAVNSRDGKTTAAPTPTGTATSSPTRTAEPSDEPTTEPTSTAEPLVARAKIRVDVLNGTDTAGLAADTAARIEDEGYERILVGNASEGGRPYRTVIFYEEGFEEEAARMLADLPELMRIKPKKPSTQGEGNLTVILGEDYEP